MPDLPFQRHSDTSRDASDSARPTARAVRAKIWSHIETLGFYGATDEEVQAVLGINPSTQRPRRVELVERGLVVDSGRRRKTTSGRWACVWVVTSGGSADLPPKRITRAVAIQQIVKMARALRSVCKESALVRDVRGIGSLMESIREASEVLSGVEAECPEARMVGDDARAPGGSEEVASDA